jgi:hypothetical protein
VFPGLSIDKAGTGYRLRVTASGLTPDTSAAFNITPGAAAVLAFSVEPTSATAGVAIAPAAQVTARDAFGNTVTSFAGTVTVAITPGTGTAGAVLSGTASVAATAGVATFSTLSIDKVGSGYRLGATSGALAPDTSATFTISAAAATQLDFTVHPTTTVAGATIAPPVEVTVKDSFGNPVRTFVGDVTLAISVNPGGGTLSGTTTVAIANGAASFGNLSINLAGVGYRLQAASPTAPGLTLASSNAFSIQ